MSSGFWGNRLKLFMVLFIYLFGVYCIQGIVLLAQADLVNEDYDTADEFGQDKYDPDYDQYNVTSEGDVDTSDIGGGFTLFDVLWGMTRFLTFADLGMPMVALVFLNIVTAIVFLVIGYLITSFIYDIVKALPFT